MFRRFLVILLVVFLLALLVLGLLLTWAYRSATGARVLPAGIEDRAGQGGRPIGPDAPADDRPGQRREREAEVAGGLHGRGDQRLAGGGPGEESRRLAAARFQRSAGFDRTGRAYDRLPDAEGRLHERGLADRRTPTSPGRTGSPSSSRRPAAGRLPLPLGDVLEQIATAARRAAIPIQWERNGANPVALIPLAPLEETRRVIHVQQLTLEQGAIYVAGTTSTRSRPP